MYEAEESSDEEVPEEISRLLKQEDRVIQPFQEPMEVVNLGSEEEFREIRIGALLAWSYQDTLGLDTYILKH